MAALRVNDSPAPGVLPMVSAALLSAKPDMAIELLSNAAAATVVTGDIPVIDLGLPRSDLLLSVKKACEWGFFQVVNHGTPGSLLQRIQAESNEFFSLKAASRGKSSFESGYEWAFRDTLKLICAPASAVSSESWPLEPVGYKETLSDYVKHQEVLLRQLLEVISESLGLERDYILNDCDDPRMMLAINLYPPCLQNSGKMGIREHSDPCTVTVLGQDGVPGLQVYKEGGWVDVKLLKDALIVNLGDHLQILSNGQYSSCLHRVVTNEEKERLSTAVFISPSVRACLKPAPSLVSANSPAIYREFVYGDFLTDFYGKSAKSTTG